MNESKEILESMPDRELFEIQIEAEEEKRKMDSLVWQHHMFTNLLIYLKKRVKKAVIDYTEYHDDDSLNDVEKYTDYIETFTPQKAKLRGEIRESRGKIQWYRKKWKKAAQKRNSKLLNKGDTVQH